MGMDPLTLGIGMGVLGKGIDMFGQYRAQNAQNSRQQYVQNMAQSMMMGGPTSWEQGIQQLLSGRKAPTSINDALGNIDIGAITAGANPGNDALMQFMRSDPSRQLNGSTTAALRNMMTNPASFNPSDAYGALAQNDQRTIQNAMTNLAGSFGGLGQRFGTAAMRQGSDLMANLGGQISARNAGIAQSSFADAQSRAMQAAGLINNREQFGSTMQFNAANALNQQGLNVAQLAAGLAQANQGNLFRNEQFNQQNLNDFFNQQMAGQQAGYGMMMGREQYNQGLLGMVAGLPMQQSPYSGIGGGISDIGQLISFLPMLRKMGGSGNLIPASTYSGGGGRVNG